MTQKDKICFTEYVHKETNSIDEIFPLKFISYDGYIPMLRIPTMYRSSDNPYFRQMYNSHVRSRIWNHVDIQGTGTTIRYKKSRSWDRSINLFSGFLTAMGTKEEFEYMPSSIFKDTSTFRLLGEVDMFCLGVVKVSNLPSIKREVPTPYNRRNRYINRNTIYESLFECSDVKILVSKELLRKTLFMKTNYSATVRKTILERIDVVTKNYKITVEDVPEDYIDQFVIRPNAVRTNSLVEVMQLNKEIKDSVFSNLKEAIYD